MLINLKCFHAAVCFAGDMNYVVALNTFVVAWLLTVACLHTSETLFGHCILCSQLCTVFVCRARKVFRTVVQQLFPSLLPFSKQANACVSVTAEACAGGFAKAFNKCLTNIRAVQFS
jgi:hypothetical protein